MVDKKESIQKRLLKQNLIHLISSMLMERKPLKKISLPVYENKITALIGPFRMR